MDTIITEDNELCPTCDAHLDEALSDVAFLMEAVLRCGMFGKPLDEILARYVITYHRYGHPSNEEANRLADEVIARRKAQRVAQCN